MIANLVNPFTDPEVASNYEAWYNTEGRRPDSLEKALLKRLLGRFPQAGSLLELGSGTGHFTDDEKLQNHTTYSYFD